MPLILFCTMVQKSQKWPKTQIKGGGPALIIDVLQGLPRSTRIMWRHSLEERTDKERK